MRLLKEVALREQRDEKLKESHVELTLAHREFQIFMKNLKQLPTKISTQRN